MVRRPTQCVDCHRPEEPAPSRRRVLDRRLRRSRRNPARHQRSPRPRPPASRTKPRAPRPGHRRRSRSANESSRCGRRLTLPECTTSERPGDPILDDQAHVRIQAPHRRARSRHRRRRPSWRPPSLGPGRRQELDALVDQLTAAYGLGGQPRRTPDRIERARKTVTRRIRDTIARTERAHPPLGRHLQASIRTGVFCSYAPERDVHWTVEAHR